MWENSITFLIEFLFVAVKENPKHLIAIKHHTIAGYNERTKLLKNLTYITFNTEDHFPSYCIHYIALFV